MKCITNNEVVKRVSEEAAEKSVKQGWTYCPKSFYKAYLRKDNSTHPDIMDAAREAPEHIPDKKKRKPTKKSTKTSTESDKPTKKSTKK